MYKQCNHKLDDVLIIGRKTDK